MKYLFVLLLLTSIRCNQSGTKESIPKEDRVQKNELKTALEVDTMNGNKPEKKFNFQHSAHS